MKKRIITAVVMLLTIVFISGCNKKDELVEINLTEVAHSIFYAPMYVAFEEGYFEEEGLKVNLVNGLGADKTMTAVLSGSADIGFMGSEASVYVYNEGAEDYVVNFAQLTRRAGNFLVARDANEKFAWDNLKGKTVIGGRAGGMPQMVFEYVLKQKGIGLDELDIIQNIDFGLTSQAFVAGTGDYTVEFEPAATGIEKEGAGTVVASLGIESGMVPYTAFSAKKSYIEKNPEIIEKFTRAIQKGLNYVNSHSSEDIAKIIEPQFAETGLETITRITKRYYDQQSWPKTTVFEESSYTLMLEILELSGVISSRPPYKDIITTDAAWKAGTK